MRELPTAKLAAAADRLLGSGGAPACGRPDPDADALLAALGYLGDGPEVPRSFAVDRHRARMLRAGARMARLFVVPTPDAPRLVMLGGEVRPSALGAGYADVAAGSVSGSGLAAGAAFEACAGEAVEFLSQFEQPGDLAGPLADGEVIEPFPTVDPQAGPADVDPTWRRDLVRGNRLGSGEPVLIPAGRCLRRVPAGPSPPFALSTGCGAGSSFEQAALHGLLELIERDAAALWWRGGRVARPVALDAEGAAEAIGLLSTLRGPSRRRASWFLDITTDLGIPAAAAVSVDGDGRRVACGTAARPDMGAALAAAIREMCQMELAYGIVDAKLRERGESALNAADRRHRARAEAVSAEGCALLHPRGRPLRHDGIAGAARDPEAALRALVGHLDERGIATYAVDLTRPALGIAVARVLAPALQLDPCEYVTRRLRRQLDATGRDGAVVSLV